MLSASGDWDENATEGFFVQNVHNVDGVYYLFYIGAQEACWPAGHNCVGLATSTDGKNFKKHPDNPVIRPQEGKYVSSWENGFRNFTVAYNPDSKKWIAYAGIDGDNGSSPGAKPRDRWKCDIEVDSDVRAFSSSDAVDWKYEGVVDGAHNGEATVILWH